MCAGARASPATHELGTDFVHLLGMCARTNVLSVSLTHVLRRPHHTHCAISIFSPHILICTSIVVLFRYHDSPIAVELYATVSSLPTVIADLSYILLSDLIIYSRAPRGRSRSTLSYLKITLVLIHDC